MWLCLLGGVGLARADQGQVDVGDKVQVSIKGFTLNRNTNTFDTLATVTNISGVTITGPMILTITQVSPASVTLANPAGTTAAGAPYVGVPLATGRLDPGTSIANIVLKFNNPNRASITFNRTVYGVPPSANHPPTANPGLDRPVFVGQTVDLDGSGSSDPDGDPLTYHWMLTGKPAASIAALAGGTGPSAQFTVDLPGTYQARLTVNDGQVDSLPATVTVTTENSRPVAKVPYSRTAGVGETLTLYQESRDADGDSLTYRWSLTSRPTQSQAALSNVLTPYPSLTPDRPGHYEIQLVVNDGHLDSLPAVGAVDTRNSPPVAKIDSGQAARVGSSYYLYTESSYDPDRDPLTYRWALLSLPPGSQTVLSNNNGGDADPFVPDMAGDYVAQLIANDGQLDSLPVTTKITATPNFPPRITSAAPLAATVGQPYQYAAAAADDNGDGLSYSLTVSPTGMVIDSYSGLIQWTPDAADIGVRPATLKVTDGYGGQALQSFEIVVDLPPNLDPRIVSIPLTSATVGHPYRYAVVATDASWDTLSFALGQAPSGLTIGQASGLIQWTPGPDQTGTHLVVVNVSDGRGGQASQSFLLIVDSPAPVPAVVGLTRAAAETALRQARLTAGAIAFRHESGAAEGLVLSQEPPAGGQVEVGTPVAMVVSLGPDAGLPPAPQTVASAIDPTVATTVADSTQFLYSGPNPIQAIADGRPLAEGTIEAKRAAVLRGRVLDQANQPLPGVAVSVKGHPELGRTLSRADGAYDLAVNGGGTLTLDFQKAGHLPSQRQENVPWQDYAGVDDVVLIPADSRVTAVTLGTAAPPQVAQGNPVTDRDGTRQATLLFPAGTQATLTLPDGTTQPVSGLHVRATEYTVGDNGPKAMPGPLPPSSGYTYAVELGADEAVAAGAKAVSFDRPVPVYVDNFLNFPVGETVPAGWYDRDKAAWIPSDNGRVIEILGATNGFADLDSDGDGQADDTVALAGLGVTPEELVQLARTYPAGKTLWRVPVTHFTPWDFNWPFGPPPDGDPPNPPGPEGDNKDKQPKPCESPGSIIECENQVLGERLPIAGTPYTLNYRSDRVPGRKGANAVKIYLSGASVPASLKRIDLEVAVAGRTFASSHPAAPNQSYLFEWDGLDAYGRPMQGRQTAKITISYVYQAAYYSSATFGQAFARFSGTPVNRATARQEIILSQQYSVELSGFFEKNQNADAGGWTLDAHHTYDPVGKTIYFGQGRQRSAEYLHWVIETVAGSGPIGVTPYHFDGDGGPAVEARMYYPSDVAVAADGSLYIADSFNGRIRRVGLDGVITTVAGRAGYLGDNNIGDGGPATMAFLRHPVAIEFGPDGSLYIAEYERVRRIGPDGVINTVAGSDYEPPYDVRFGGDGGPATEAKLQDVSDIAFGPDGSLYISDSNNYRIRRVGPNGVIDTVAGNGQVGYSGDGGPATSATFIYPGSIVVDAKGNLYIADRNDCVRRVGPDGIINTVAGHGNPGPGSNGDGGPANRATLATPHALAIGPDGSLYISTAEDDYVTGDLVRRVGPDGIINTVAGNGHSGYSGDGGPPRAASLYLPAGITISPDGSLYIADYYSHRIRHVHHQLPGITREDHWIPSEDGDEIYHFSPSGRHLQTVDALTGAIREQFDYDAAGRLLSVMDGDGNTTLIERDALGNPIAFIAPHGQRTLLTLDAHGHLASVANPAGEAHRMAYTDDGLLTRFETPNGHASTFRYDDLGRLIEDKDARGNAQTLALTRLTQSANDYSYEVVRTTAEGRQFVHRVEQLANTDQRRTVVNPAGLTSATLSRADGATTRTSPDGTVTTLTEGPDPRFGMQAPITKSLTVRTGGLTASLATERTVTNNLSGLATLTDRVTLNGRASATTYDAASHTVTDISPLGRMSVATLDAKGRTVAESRLGLLDRHYEYDARGRLTRAAQGAGADERAAAFAYDAQGHLQSITDPLGRQVGYEYDAAGRVTQTTLPDGRSVQFGYDADGNLTSLLPPGQPAHLFRYGLADLAEEYAPPAANPGGSTVYDYNRDKDLTRITRPDGQAIALGYDSAGRLATLATPDGTTTYGYSASTGQLTQVAAPGSTLAYAYSGALLTQAQWTGTVAGTVNYAYDTDFRVREVKLNGANPVAYGYDNDGLLISAGALTLSRDARNGLLTGTALGRVTDRLDYDGFGEARGYTAKLDDAPLFAAAHAHDKLGRITRTTETVQGVATVRDYGYDQAGRLAEVKTNGAVTASYGYDANGNRTTLNGQAVARYDAQDRLLDYQGTAYAYTANGELLGKTRAGQTTRYRYDALGNLRHVDLPGGAALDYVIDGRNRRIGKKVNGALVQGFLYQGRLRPVAELNGAGQVVSRFVYADKSNVPAYLIKGGATYRIISDHLGSPRLVINTADGTVAQRMDYDEWGKVTYDSNPGFQPFGFAGGLYDRDTGLVRFGARDYDPETGRWTAKDPIGFLGDDTNLYAYVFNNPVVSVDPSGFAEEPPPLQRIHPDSTYENGSAKYSYEYWKQQSTDEIVRSLRPENPEGLKSWPDGRVVDGNTRLKVLQERGFDINKLPRSLIPRTPIPPFSPLLVCPLCRLLLQPIPPVGPDCPR